MEEILSQMQNYIIEAGPWGPLVYVLAMVIAIVISPIPSSPLAILAGAIFGWTEAFILTMIGAVGGAIIAFYIARMFGRPIVEKLISPSRLAEIEEMMPERHLALAIFFLRIPPLPFFDAISYAAGLTKISFRSFTIATFFGLIPIVFTLSYFGGMAFSTTNLTIIVLAVTVIFFIFLRYYYKNRLKKRLPSH